MFGVLPLAIASGAGVGAAAQQSLGIFLVPMFYMAVPGLVGRSWRKQRPVEG